jgi:hypothetical protein
MAELFPVEPVSTFVVRFWRDWSAAGSRWRGHIEHVQSGESAAFLELDAMLSFLRRFSVAVDDRGHQAERCREG